MIFNSFGPRPGVSDTPSEVDTACLTFSSPTTFTIATNRQGWTGTMEYSTNKTNWTPWTGSEVSSVLNGNKYYVYLRGTGNTRITRYINSTSILYTTFDITGSDVSCDGNIETLLDYATVAAGEHPTMESYCFAQLFDACTALIKAPELPSVTLADHCYSDMFNQCSNLVEAPSLPATTLKEYCYSSMFIACTNMTGIPALPATTLASNCYTNMFNECSAIKLSLSETGEYTQEYRIPSTGTAGYISNAFTNMFASTGGTFTRNPSINTTYYLSSSNTIV